MRCPVNRGQPRVLYQVSVLLLWILHTATCQDEHPVTSWRPEVSITTVEPTSTTGPGTITSSFSDQAHALTSSHPPETVSPDDRASPQTDPYFPVTPTTSSGHYGNPGDQSLGATSTITPAKEIDPQSGSGQFSVTPPVPYSSPLSSSLHATNSSSAQLEQGVTSTAVQPTSTLDIYSESVPQLFPSQTSFPAPPSPSSSSSSPLEPHRTRLELSPSHDVTPPLLTSQPTSSIVNDLPSSTETSIPSVLGSNITDIMATSLVTSSPDASHMSNLLSDVNTTSSVTQEGDLFSSTPSGEMWNQTSVLPPTSDDGDKEGLSVGATVGISVACVLVVVSGVLVGLAVLYHRHKSRKLDTTKAPRDHYTGLWDDNITLSYINNHFDFFQKDAQDEMISLDNDAYLNSLEFMVFTNTWGDGKRNTRF